MAPESKSGKGFRVITEDEIKVSPRGRRKVLDPNLLEALRHVKPGQPVVLEMFGSVTDKADKQTVGASIRRHWREIRNDESRIDFAPGTGEVQVQVRKA